MIHDTTLNKSSDNDQATENVNKSKLTYEQFTTMPPPPAAGTTQLFAKDDEESIQKKDGEEHSTTNSELDSVVGEELNDSEDMAGGEVAMEANEAEDDGFWKKWMKSKQKNKYEKTKAKNAKNVSKLVSVINSGITSADLRFKNSCRTIKLGMIKVFALTKTSDSNKRKKEANKVIKRRNKQVEEMNKNNRLNHGPAVRQIPNQPLDTRVRYFPNPGFNKPGDIFSPQVYYNWEDPLDSTNIFAHRSAAKAIAHSKERYIGIVEPADQSEDYIKRTISHETQHALDRPGDTERTTPISRYKSEYRAYSYANMNDFSMHNDTTPVNHDGKTWSSERQYQIFNHIKTNYSYVATAWRNNTDGFRDKVVKYSNPDTEGFNKYNSPKIDMFFSELDKISRTPELKAPEGIGFNKDKKNGIMGNLELSGLKIREGSLACPKVAELMDKFFSNPITKLDKADTNYILNEGHAIRNKIIEHVDFNVYNYIMSSLRDGFKGKVIKPSKPVNNEYNKINSPKIDMFYNDLDQISRTPDLKIPQTIDINKGKNNNFMGGDKLSGPKIKEGSLTCPKVSKLIDKYFINPVTKLDKADADYILKDGHAIRNKIAKHVDFNVYMNIMNKLGNIR